MVYRILFAGRILPRSSLPQAIFVFLTNPISRIYHSLLLNIDRKLGLASLEGKLRTWPIPESYLHPSLSWHHRPYQLPFKRLFQLARYKLLPKLILTCDAKPLCVACQFGMAHQHPWCCKNKVSGSIRCSNKILPGDGTSVDQIVLVQPGLIPQMAGFFASDWIWGTTIFCNHFSNFVYVHLMWNFTLEETLQAKRAYEKVLAQAGRRAKHYHADNGRSSDRSLHQDVDDKGQSISFCGVGAHHQNGIIENRNKQLTLGARTLLMHGIRHWPQMVDTMFWPFAIKAMADRLNSLHMDDNGNTPESIMFEVNLDSIPVRISIPFSAQYMSLITACNLQVDLAHQNGNPNLGLGYT
jgi:hypothetical protein